VYDRKLNDKRIVYIKNKQDADSRVIKIKMINDHVSFIGHYLDMQPYQVLHLPHLGRVANVRLQPPE
jgi:hypothetical protein